MIEKVGIRTVDDFYHSKWKKIQELMKETSKLSPERQKLFSRALKLLWTEGNKAMKETVKQTVKRTVKRSPKNKKSIKSQKMSELIKKREKERKNKKILE
jgi:glutamyl-tRNA reductase